jgi:hypothetical protein
MAETWWSAAPLTLDPGADVVGAVVGLAQSLLCAGTGAPVGLLLCVLGPGLDGSAARAALEALIPGAPVVVLQAAGVIVGGELITAGVGMLLGQWDGPPAVLQRAPPAARGLWLCFCEGKVPWPWPLAAGASPGLIAPMGPGGPVWIGLPPTFVAETRLERSAEPVGPVMQITDESDGRVWSLNGEVADKALAALGARLPEAARERLRTRPLLLSAACPAWAVGGRPPRARVLGVDGEEGALLLDRPIGLGAGVQLGAPRARSMSAQLSARPLRADGLRLGLLICAPDVGAPDPARSDELAALQLVIGAPLLFGLVVEQQGLSGHDGAATMTDCDLLVALREPPWD